MSSRKIELRAFRRIVILTGAGISVASGLPTYRGSGGLWNSADVQRHATAAALAADPRSVWEFFASLRAQVATASPNAAHVAIAEAASRLGDEQRLTVLTQNVDGLHRKAGSKLVVELHGTVWRSRCSSCAYLREEERAVHEVGCPSCPECAKALRPDVVLFGEPLSVDVEWQSKKALRDCDLFIAVGTSGTVSPASNFVRSADFAGARTVYINLEPMRPPNPAFHEVHLGRAEDLVSEILGV